MGGWGGEIRFILEESWEQEGAALKEVGVFGQGRLK